MASATRHGLRLRDKFDRGGTGVGFCRTRRLADQKQLDADDLKSMHAYLARHAVDERGTDDWEGDKDPSVGDIVWLLWGGDPGKQWADRKWPKLGG